MNKRFAFVFAAATLALSGLAHAAKPAAPVVLPSGVQVSFLSEAKPGAERPAATNKVQVHYRGTLDNGTEFDSSYKRGQPAVFGLNQVIPCWTQGMQQLAVGQKARLTCPSDTAYGPRGIPGTIPPGATLTFEVELLSIVR